MLLLPVGFVAFMVSPPLTPRALMRGLGLALGVAILVHLAALAAPATLGPPGGEAFRLALRNDIGFGGLGALGAVLAMPWLRAGGGPAAAVTATAAGALLVGSMSRGAWIAVAIGVIVGFFLSGRSRRPWLARALVPLGGVFCGLVMLLILAPRVGQQIVVVSGRDTSHAAPEPQRATEDPLASRPMHMTAGPNGGGLEIVRDQPLRAYGVELDATLRGDQGKAASLVLAPSGHDGVLPEMIFTCDGGAKASRLHIVQQLPEGTERVSLSLWAASGTWSVEEFRLRPLPGTSAMWLRAVLLRFTSTVAALSSPHTDGTLTYRFREWEAIRAQWSRAGLGRRLGGQGLGATFAFPNSSWDNEGRRVLVPTASYIHSFYVFLAFKLGLAGLAALGGLLLVVGWTASRALAARRAAESGPAWFLAAAISAWLTFLLWSVTSPEILNFRMAPLWGALIAASCDAARNLSPPRPETGTHDAPTSVELSPSTRPRRGRPRPDRAREEC
jgi:hypothetical protein